VQFVIVQRFFRLRRNADTVISKAQRIFQSQVRYAFRI
jgi:hypothetical protein